MDDEKLILLVKKRDEIYNKSNPLYKYIDSKKEAWEEIGQRMGVPAEDCQRRWTTLRDRYTRECRKNNQGLDNDGKTYMWPFFEMMEFLRPFIAPRPHRAGRITRIAIPPSIIRKRSPPSSPEPVESPRTSPEPFQSPKASPAQSPAASPVNCQEFTQIFDDPLIDPSFLRKKRKISTNPDVDKSFCDAVETLKKACAQNEARNANPAVYAFGEMIVSTICKMNSRNQMKAMQQVTDIVMRIKLEEDDLMEQVTYSTI